MSIFVHVALIFLSALAGLVGAEMFTRTLYPQDIVPLTGNAPNGLRVPDFELGWFHKSNLSTSWVSGTTVRTNSIGLRDRNFELKECNEVRVLSLGDSFAFGFGVELHESYARQLEDLLQLEHPKLKISVINAAVSGYNTFQQKLIFERFHELLEPDLVLATFVASNDVYENEKFERMLNRGYISDYGILGRYSHIVRMIMNRTGPIRIALENRNQENVNITIKAINQLYEKVRSEKLPFYMIIIPARHQIDTSVNLFTNILNIAGFLKYILLPNSQIIEFLDKNEINYLDLYEIFQNEHKKSSIYFKDDFHTNTRGHHLIAVSLFRMIRDHPIFESGRENCQLFDGSISQ